MEDVISRIISDLEGIHNLNPQTPISEQTLLDLQTIVDHQTLNDDGDPDQISPLWEELSSRNVSLSSIISPITSAMESGSIPLSLLSSKVYLSLILSPNSPTLGLFTPMAFNSLLRAIRRAFKDGRGPYTSSDDRRRGFGSSHRRGKGKRSLNSGEEEREREKNELDVRLLFNVLDRLGLVMGLLHLERFPDSLKSLVQTVAEIPVLGSELCGNSGNYKKLSDLCMRVLDEVLSNEYGDTAATAAEVLKFLSPLILMLNSQARTFALGFVIHRMMVMKKNSDAINKAVVNLPRYLLQKAPEKSEARALAVQSIMEIVKAMHFEDQVGFLDYVSKMAQGKAHLRLLAVDLFPLLLVSLREPSGLVLGDKVEDSWRWRCLGALIERCSDANAGIRARALLNMAQLVGNLSSGEQGHAMLKKLMALKNGNSNNKQEGGMNDLLRKRCRDEKAAVRKAAILVISKLMTLGGGLDGDILKAVGMACSDSLVSIRKAAISALSEAFRNTSDTSVIIEWLHSVPRLITDSEASIQEECENFFLELVLDRVSRAGSVQLLSQPVTHNSNVNRENLDREMAKLCPNGVFDLLKEICNGEVAPWVKKICRSLVKKNKLKPKIATALQNIISTSESLWLSHSMPIENWTAPCGAWLLLSEVSSFLPKAVNWEFLHHHWQLLDKNGVESEFKIPPQEDRGEGKESMESDSVAWASDRVLLLQTIAKVSVELPPESAVELAHNLFKRLEKFNMHLTEVNAHVQALKTLCKRKALNPEEADALVTKWVHQILTKALRIIQAYLSDEPEFSIETAFVTPTASVSKNGKRAVALSRRLCQATTAVYTIGSLVIICPSIDLKEIIPVLLSIITSGSPELRPNGLPGSTASLKQKAPSLFIQAWLTMGKICLADGKLAKRYIPLFVQELEKSDCAALRNNIIVTMADFCVRYTALVDCHIAKITKCLRDPCELVRRQTFILLSRLLQRDYVKWRGILFLRFLLSLVDESEKIRQLADFLFGNILKAKAPLLAYNSFVEAVFVLNDCHHAHMGHGSSQNSRVENRLFSIRGNDEKARSERMHIYVSLLKQMSPEHLLATFAKICAEILATASDGVLRIEDAPGQAVLQDAFQILTCKEIRIASSRGSSSDSGEVEEEGGDGGPASSSAARGRVITQAVKKSLIQNTIPIFIELKRLLESKNSPLIGSLMECLRLLLKDYKNEIDDLLVADIQLQKELIYDMQKYETGKARSTATEAVAAVQRSAGYQASGVRMSASAASAREPSKKLKNDPKVASAMADAAAAAKARSVLREVNQGASTPPLSSIKVPKLKFSRRLASPAAAADATGDRCVDLLQSVRRRHTFTDEEN